MNHLIELLVPAFLKTADGDYLPLFFKARYQDGVPLPYNWLLEPQ